MNETLKTILTRRSVRKYKPEQIASATLTGQSVKPLLARKVVLCLSNREAFYETR